MNEAQTLAYVRAAAVALDLPLDDAQAARVAVHLQRTAGLAATLQDVVQTYNTRQSLGLTAPDIADLVQYLKSL